MGNWLASLGSDNIRILIVSIAVIAVVGSIVAGVAWATVRTSEHRARLAALLLDRGFKPNEIELVLRAVQRKPDGDTSLTDEPVTPDEAEVRMVKALTGQSYEAVDVQKVLSAARESGPMDAATVKLVESLAAGWYEADDMAKLLRDRKERTPNIKQHPAVA